MDFTSIPNLRQIAAVHPHWTLEQIKRREQTGLTFMEGQGMGKAMQVTEASQIPVRSAGDGELQTTPPSLQWQAPWSTGLGVGGGRVTRKQRLSGTRWLSAPISAVSAFMRYRASRL